MRCDKATMTRIARLPIEYRFWIFVKKQTKNKCWLWLGRKSKRGYGVLVHKGRTWRAHRLWWTLQHGSIPRGKVLCHHCDTRACIRPSHLFLGTPADNNADMHKKGRNVRGERTAKAKLTAAKVRQIRALWRPRKVSARYLGARFGVSERQVWNVLKRTSWNHVAEDDS